MRLPRSLGLVLTGFAGIVGIRTPPDPAVVAQTQPARPPTVPPPTGPPPPDPDGGSPPAYDVDLPPARPPEAVADGGRRAKRPDSSARA